MAALEAPVRLRRNRPPTDASRAREAAAEARTAAEIERDRQRSLAEAEHHEVIAPLRQMREHNHLADLFLRSLERGRHDSGPAAG